MISLESGHTLFEDIVQFFTHTAYTSAYAVF